MAQDFRTPADGILMLQPRARLACVSLLMTPFFAACGIGDKAQLPRSIATPSTFAGAVLDLQNLDQASLEPWMDVMDPQALHLEELDNFQWRTQGMRQAGIERLLALADLQPGGELRYALLLRCSEGSDALRMLEAFWDWASPHFPEWQADQLHLAQWQEGWWLLEAPNLWQPLRQSEEHGAPLHSMLAENRSAPIRMGLAIGDQPRATMQQALAKNPFAFWLLGNAARPIASLRSGSMSLASSRRSPRLRMRFDFESAEYAERFEQSTSKALDEIRGLTQFFQMLSLPGDPPAHTSAFAEASDLRNQALDKCFALLRLQNSGSACHLTLDREFFSVLRHLRNLQTQAPIEVARR